MKLQHDDEDLKVVFQWIRDGGGPSRKRMDQGRAGKDLWHYLQLLSSIREESGMLIMNRLAEAPTRDVRLLVPRAARLRITAVQHEAECGHLGVDHTVRSIQSWA